MTMRFENCLTLIPCTKVKLSQTEENINWSYLEFYYKVLTLSLIGQVTRTDHPEIRNWRSGLVPRIGSRKLSVEVLLCWDKVD